MTAKTRGRRVNLADMDAAVGDGSPVDGPSADLYRGKDGQFRRDVPLDDLAPNPRNPRAAVGDLSDLSSIAQRQLQPAVAISRRRWLDLWPEDQDAIGPARWVVVNGCRRLAASREFGRRGLDIVVHDSIAESKAEVVKSAISENIDRRNLDVVEEARAVELLVAELSSAKAAAEKLGRTEGWVSQRRALLHLAPELLDKLRAGELAVREARSLARVPRADQVAAWVRSQGEGEDSRPDGPERSDTEASRQQKRDQTPATAVRALRRLKAPPAILAAALTEVLTHDELHALISELRPEA